MEYEKAYKEAIESIKRIYEQADSFGKELMRKEFPELRESKDEKIREELYRYFRDLQLSSDREFSPSISIDEILAWLEKQANIPHFTFDDILALQCAMKTTEKADNELYEQLKSLHDRLHDAYWLEKQGG